MKQEIKPVSKSDINIKELFLYKELLFMLSYRDFKIKYAQTFLGFSWAFIQPLFTLLIFIFIFNKTLHVQTGAIPYPIFALSGLVAWSFFVNVVSQTGSSLVNSSSLITKIYFPRLIIPISKMFVGFVDFAIAILFLIALMVYYQFVPSLNILFLPLFIGLLVLLSTAVGILVSALSIRYRDIQYIIPFVMQIGMYITPIAFPVNLIPIRYKMLYYLNPIAGLIEGFRWCIIGESPLDTRLVAFTILFTLTIIFISIRYFNKVGSEIADLI